MAREWLPKGGDGHSMPDFLAVGAVAEESMSLAMQTFKGMVLAIEADDVDKAQSLWERLVDGVSAELNPYALLVTVATVTNAAILRFMAGDPQPMDAPEWAMDIEVIGVDRKTGKSADVPLEEFAGLMISYAANWHWDDLNALMTAKLRQEDDVDDFLHELGACLMSFFIGVGGSEAAGWRS